jgi:hypothetical protein
MPQMIVELRAMQPKFICAIISDKTVQKEALEHLNKIKLELLKRMQKRANALVCSA